jgi:hypothetical protein
MYKRLTDKLQVWSKHIPYVRPCYSVSNASSSELITLLKYQRVPMICHNTKEFGIVNDESLTIMDRGDKRGRLMGRNGSEYLIRSIKQLHMMSSSSSSSKTTMRASPGPLLWIHTVISNNALDDNRRMFEYVWENKYILNGIVIDISNFSGPVILPSIYSYKIAIDYAFRNMIHPFHNEYGIMTPAIMLDGRNIITRKEHIIQLNEYALRKCQFLWEKKSITPPRLYLMVDRLLDEGEIE